jgi:tetraacyldisaccharide 4'-kinase
MKTPRFWQSSNVTSSLLLPASALYRLGAWADRRLTSPQRAPLPVISIGNVTAGGAGKTPTTIALAALLRNIGHTPHILTRGYGGAALIAHRVTDTANAATVGDEALLLARAAPTWVGRNRLASAHAALANGATAIVCDDALQHHSLHKDSSILVIDGGYGIGNGLCLPAGPLREPIADALKRCDAVILIGDDAQQLAAQISIPLFRATLEANSDSSFLHNEKWLAFAGIGRPEKFYTTLRNLGAHVVATHDYPDHHAYSERDMNHLATMAADKSARLITTEKDAVKLPPRLRGAIATLPVQLRFDAPTAMQQFLSENLEKCRIA